MAPRDERGATSTPRYHVVRITVSILLLLGGAILFAVAAAIGLSDPTSMTFMAPGMGMGAFLMYTAVAGLLDRPLPLPGMSRADTHDDSGAEPPAGDHRSDLT